VTPLTVKVTRRAAREITKACEWWDANRPAAPGALRSEIERVFGLIAVQPGIGARALNAKLSGVRRVHLSRVRYHLYYRPRLDHGTVEVLAMWHTSRGAGPRV
jgi:plasmid stabilization system protein ParE